jgi:hypothetical protein
MAAMEETGDRSSDTSVMDLDMETLMKAKEILDGT